MGRRSRKRSLSPSPPPSSIGTPARVAPAAPRTPVPRAKMAEAPKAAWAPFPLTELCILLSLVLLAIGFLSDGDRREVLLGGGFVVLALAGGELALREHLAGFRSHSSLLAGLCAVATAALLTLVRVPYLVVVVLAVIVFAAVLWQLRAVFMRRSGGLRFRA